MHVTPFPVIDPVATGKNILRLRTQRGLSVRDLQAYFGFEEPQAIYKWQQGKSLPTVDNLYALGALLEVPMEDILVSTRPQLNLLSREQQTEAACCSPLFYTDFFSGGGYGRSPGALGPFLFGVPLSPIPQDRFERFSAQICLKSM